MPPENESHSADRLRRVHLAAVLRMESAEVIQGMRRRWDPVMAAVVPPHLTVVYPEEAPDSALLASRAAEQSLLTPSFTVRLTTVFASDSGRGGVFVAVRDTSSSWRRLRAELLATPFVAGDVAPHVTIAHPRTMVDGEAAYQAVRELQLDLEVWITELSLTETTRSGFGILDVFPLR